MNEHDALINEHVVHLCINTASYKWVQRIITHELATINNSKILSKLIYVNNASRDSHKIRVEELNKLPMLPEQNK